MVFGQGRAVTASRGRRLSAVTQMMLSAEGPSWIFCILRVLADILCLNHNVCFTPDRRHPAKSAYYTRVSGNGGIAGYTPGYTNLRQPGVNIQQDRIALAVARSCVASVAKTHQFLAANDKINLIIGVQTDRSGRSRVRGISVEATMKPRTKWISSVLFWAIIYGNEVRLDNEGRKMRRLFARF